MKINFDPQVSRFFHVLLLLGLGLLASAQAQNVPLVPSSLPKGKIIDRVLYLNQRKTGLHCPTGVVKGGPNWDGMKAQLVDLNLSPECIWVALRKTAAEFSDRRVQGFAFGAVGEISTAFGYEFGTELVVMKYSDDALMVGQVKLRGASASLALPAGASLTQSVILGNCDEGLFGYLGWFENASIFARGFHQGKVGYYPFFRKGSGCDAYSLTRGLSTPVFGVSETYYSQLGKFALVTGPRAKELIQFIDQLNSDQPDHNRWY